MWSQRPETDSLSWDLGVFGVSLDQWFITVAVDQNHLGSFYEIPMSGAQAHGECYKVQENAIG